MDQNYKGNTKIKSELTKCLFRDFKNAYFHFKSRIEASERIDYTFVMSIENALPYICNGKGDRTHINDDDIKMLHQRCEAMVSFLNPMPLNDIDKTMLDIIVKTGNYLAIILDLIEQNSRLRVLESESLENRKRKYRDESAQPEGGPGSLDSNLQSLCLLREYI